MNGGVGIMHEYFGGAVHEVVGLLLQWQVDLVNRQVVVRDHEQAGGIHVLIGRVSGQVYGVPGQVGGVPGPVGRVPC